MFFFFKLLLLNLLKLMEEIKKLKTNKILGKYTGRGITESNPSFNRMTNEFAFRGKRGNGREKKIIVLRIVSLLLQSITHNLHRRGRERLITWFRFFCNCKASQEGVYISSSRHMSIMKRV